MKRKILILANSDVGLYKFRKELIQELLNQEYEVYISLPYGEFVDEMTKLGCDFIDTPMQRRGTNPIQDFSLFRRYNKILKQIKPDVALSYTVKPNIYGGLACSLKKVPCLANVTGLGTTIENEGFMQKLVLKLYHMGIKNARCVFFQNSSNEKFFRDKMIVTGKTELLPGSGVNLDNFEMTEYPENKEAVRFLFIGRIMRDKGVNELFEAAKAVKQKYHDAVFDVLGDYDEDYSEQVDRLSQEGVICYHGQQKDVRPFIKACFAVVLPSYHEGMANVLLEGAASGRPVIASDIPGCRETFEEGVSGFGFAPKNSSDLADKLIKFIELPYDEKKRMGVNGRRLVENIFDRNIIVNKYINEIKKILEEK